MKKWLIAILSALLAFSFAACGESQPDPTEPSVTEPEGPVTYSRWTENEYLAPIPAYLGENMILGETEDCGPKQSQIDLNNVKTDDYWAYIEYLEENGFDTVVTNGDEGLQGYVYSATLQSADRTVVLTYIDRINKMYVMATTDMTFSPNLFYDDSYIANNIPGKQTTLTLRELYQHTLAGLSNVIQLKNGHFILVDGGFDVDARNLIDYLKKLSGGEKPVVEALFVTHVIEDHMGFVNTILMDETMSTEFYLNQVIYSEPSTADMGKLATADTALVTALKSLCWMTETEDGDFPNIYRPHTGERFYFNDITVDIVLSQEQVPLQDATGSVRDTSSWYLFTIEGQTYLNGGDSAFGSQGKAVLFYPSEFFQLDLMNSFAHSSQNRPQFIDYIAGVTTVLDSHYFYDQSEWNDHLKNDIAKEWLMFGDRGKVLTFPYTVGTSKNLPELPTKPVLN